MQGQGAVRLGNTVGKRLLVRTIGVVGWFYCITAAGVLLLRWLYEC
jgi:hypothetical protein